MNIEYPPNANHPFTHSHFTAFNITNIDWSNLYKRLEPVYCLVPRVIRHKWVQIYRYVYLDL